MHDYQSVGSLTYTLWSEFIKDFIMDFCPKNKIQTSRTELETPKYYQGSWTVDEYVDDLSNKHDILRELISVLRSSLV